MPQAYIAKALETAHYEIFEDGTYYGEIPPMPGVWANEASLEECRRILKEVIEGWLFLKIRDGDPMPVIGGINLNTPEKETHTSRRSSRGPTPRGIRGGKTRGKAPIRGEKAVKG